MAMVRNESVGRTVMLLCFGTAILSLAVHWRITTAQGYVEEARAETRPNLQRSHPESVDQSLPPASLGEVALGASVPTQASSKSSAIKRHPKSETISKNVANATDLPSKKQLVVQEQKDNETTQNWWPKFFLAQASSNEKSFNGAVSMKTQVVVDLSDRRAYVYAKDEVIASYPLAIGKKGWETPTGSFRVIHMQHHPIWRHPITGKIFEAGTDSPLGDRWIGFWSDGRNEIGFHGTPDTDLIGTAVSHGCLRMRNPDVRLLYKQVSLGTPVLVRD